MPDQLYGIILYAISLLTMGGIYAVMAIGLNLQWGLAGILNIGIAGFFAIGAYASAILTSLPQSGRMGSFDLPVPIGFIAAIVFSALIALMVARLTIKLRSDYLAIATIGIAEIIRLIAKNEIWLTGGAYGISNLPRPGENLPGIFSSISFLLLVLALLAVTYWLAEFARRSPWDRVMRAIRDNEIAARAFGKDSDKFRTGAFIFGASLMGVAGALTAHYLKYFGPTATEPATTTFLVWVMLIVGGSGSNKGAMIGAFIMWFVWSATEIFTGYLPSELVLKAPYLRVFLIGFILVYILQKAPQGLLGPKEGSK